MSIDTRPPRQNPYTYLKRLIAGMTGADNVRPPDGDERDFDRWAHGLSRKLGNSDATFDDIEARSSNPLLGMMQEIQRKQASIERDTRNLRAEIEMLKHQQPEKHREGKIGASIIPQTATTHNLMIVINDLKRRVANIEGEL